MIAIRRPLLLVALLAGGCGDTPSPPRPPEPAPAAAAARPPARAASAADEVIAACLRSTYNLGRAGVFKASCEVHVVWDRRYFREAIEFDGRFEFADGKGAMRWEERTGGPEWEELTRFLDPDWLGHDLAGSTPSFAGGPAVGVAVVTSGENRMRARSLTFASDGTLEEAVVRTACGDGVEREGVRTYAYEIRNGRSLLVKHRIAFAEADCSDETTFRWSEQDGLPVPSEIHRQITAGKEYDATTLRLSGWKLEVGPGK